MTILWLMCSSLSQLWSPTKLSFANYRIKPYIIQPTRSSVTTISHMSGNLHQPLNSHGGFQLSKNVDHRVFSLHRSSSNGPAPPSSADTIFLAVAAKTPAIHSAVWTCLTAVFTLPGAIPKPGGLFWLQHILYVPDTAYYI